MIKSANPHRPLTAEEQKLYAAGMAAHRRGELRPTEELPFEQYKIWKMGWNRIGRGPEGGSFKSRAKDHNTKITGVHMVRTEVESFDDALKLIENHQRSKRAGETIKSQPRTLRQQLGDYQGAVRFAEIRERRERAVALQTAESGFERSITERITKAIELLWIAAEERSVMAAMNQRFPAVTQPALLQVIDTLCKMLRVEMPTFSVTRQPGQASTKQTRLCFECGTELEQREIEYCRHCRPETESARIASEFKREHLRNLAGLEREAKQLTKAINGAERALDEHQRHGGHPGEDAADLETDRREEDHDSGGAAAHQLGADGSRDSES